MSPTIPPTTSRFRIVCVWAAVFVFWLFVGRRNQPTWPMAFGATAVLVGAAAVAVTIDGRMLAPALATHRRWPVYVGALLALVAGLSFPTVELIQWLYDAGGIPREVRFGFWTNVAYEVAWLALHLVGGIVVRWRMRSRRRTPSALG